MVTKKRVKQKIPARDEDAQSFERFLSLLPRENQPDVLLKLFVSLKKKRKSCPRDRQAVTHSTTPPGDSRRLVRSSYLESRHIRFIRGIVKSGKSDVCGMDISVGYDMSAHADASSFKSKQFSTAASTALTTYFFCVLGSSGKVVPSGITTSGVGQPSSHLSCCPICR